MGSLPKIRIAFLEVGQGDSIVISNPATKEAVIIDCPEADIVFDYLATEQIKYVRALIITHLHLDHYKDAIEFMDNCQRRLGVACEKLLFNWPSPGKNPHYQPDSDQHSEIYAMPAQNYKQKRSIYENLKRWADENQHTTSEVYSHRSLPIHGSLVESLQILQPSHGQLGQLMGMGINNTAAIIRVQGTATSALLTSDIEPAGWRTLLKQTSALACDVLKFPHHGAWREDNYESNPDEILNIVNPSYVIICVGTQGEKYHHPNKHVFRALRSRADLKLLCTQATLLCCLGAEEL